MSEIDAWRNYAATLGFPLPEEAEKDYLQELLLHEIYALAGDKLVFRGGTAISKIYGSGRFSEDLDFVLASRDANAEKSIEAGIKNMSNYFQSDYTKERYKDMVEFVVDAFGPLYLASHNPAAKQRIKVDLNVYERPMASTNALLVTPIYKDVRPYSLIVEREAELLADKVKAAIERRKKHKTAFARDIYDAWFLVNKYGIKPDLGLVAKKMKLYGTAEFKVEDFKQCIDEAGKYWRQELGRFIASAPPYDDVRELLIGSIG